MILCLCSYLLLFVYILNLYNTYPISVAGAGYVNGTSIAQHTIHIWKEKNNIRYSNHKQYEKIFVLREKKWKDVNSNFSNNFQFSAIYFERMLHKSTIEPDEKYVILVKPILSWKVYWTSFFKILSTANMKIPFLLEVYFRENGIADIGFIGKFFLYTASCSISSFVVQNIWYIKKHRSNSKYSSLLKMKGKNKCAIGSWN